MHPLILSAPDPACATPARLRPGREGRAGIEQGLPAPDRVGLPGAPAAQGIREGGVGDPVPAADPGRQEAAGDLVLALGARLEAADPFTQAVFDALVVAGLEVQAGQLHLRAPVTA